MTEKQEICTYPDCGCPEARLCYAGNPNEAAINLNRPPKERIKKDHEGNCRSLQC